MLSTPTEMENTIDETRLQRRISLQIKHTYCRERLRDQKSAIFRTAYRGFTVETYTFPQTDYDDSNGSDDLTEYNCYGQSIFTYLPCLTKLMNSKFETYWKKAMHLSCYRLRCYQALHGAQTASPIWTAIRTGIHRHIGIDSRVRCRPKIVGKCRSGVCFLFVLNILYSL
jgi:hypothetical protein